MATMQRRLVHKQFNSPINLYSQRNIQETLDRELKQLSNGAIGIDFDDPSTTKPQSLAKSAVLQALEEEEREQSRAGKGLKRVAWPPPAEFGDDYQHQQPVQQQPVQQPYQQPYQQPAQHPSYPQQQQQQYQQPQQQPRERIIPIQRATSHISPVHTPKSPVNQLKYPSYPPSSPHQTLSAPHYPAQQQQQHRGGVSPSGGSATVAFSGGRAVVPQKQPARPVSAPYYQQQQQQQQQQQPQNRYSSPSTASLASPRSPQIASGGHSPRGWAHVQSPVPVYRPTPQPHLQQQQPYVPPPFQTQPAPYQQQQRPTSGAGYGYGYGPRKPEPSTQQPQYQPQPTQAFQPLVPHQQQQQQQQQQLYQQPEVIPQHYQQQPPVAAAADSQLPFITTLRKEAPMSQEPTPVYHTEPVAAIYQGGTNMRGDQKWPPADVKKQSDLENEERLKLAQQPAFRPRKVQKDYSEFFAKNALNATYPGYRAPPGTQHHS